VVLQTDSRVEVSASHVQEFVLSVGVACCGTGSSHFPVVFMVDFDSGCTSSWNPLRFSDMAINHQVVLIDAERVQLLGGVCSNPVIIFGKLT
jgi:hypothetical protein